MANQDEQDLDLFNNNPRLDLFSNNYYSQSFSDILRDTNLVCKYYTENSIIDSFSNVEDIFCISINVASLYAKFSQIKDLIDFFHTNELMLGVISIQETWVSDFELFSIPGYKLVGNNRKMGRGGGVACYINSNFNFDLLFPDSYFIENFYESITFKIEINSKIKFILTNIYRPPGCQGVSHSVHLNSFFDIFSENLECMSKFNLPIILTGDLNINSLCDNNEATQLLDIFSFFGYSQLTSKATRLQNDSATLIDYVCTNELSFVNSVGVLVESMSDHFINFFSIKSNKSSIKTSNFMTRDFSAENQRKFAESLQNLRWNQVLSIQETNQACDQFVSIFFNFFELSFPLKKIKAKKKRLQNFISKGLMVSRKTCNKLYRKAKLRPSEANKDSYRKYRNLFNSTMRKAKKFHYRRQILRAGKNTKKVWQIIKENANIQTIDKSKISSVVSNGLVFTDEKLIGNLFNDHFTTLGEKAKQYIPKTTHSFREFLPPRSRQTFFMQPIHEELMKNYILSIPPKSSTDINGISAKILHLVAPSISIPLTHIFNLSMEEGKFPEIFKTSKVVPIFKAGDSKNLNNYRGVSLINIFGKIFEKIVAARLRSFLENQSFFYKKQFGFRSKHSTQHAILQIINKISSSINQGKISLLFCLDIYKCFDIIDHKLLLYKLEHYGVRGVALSWFKSYLENREQRVMVNGVLSSNVCKILESVFQGSVMGVLLFLLFINDLPNCCSILDITLFADDNQSFIDDFNPDVLLKKANMELEKLKIWYATNKLAIHPLKSKFLLFYPRWKNLNIPIFNDRLYFPLYLNLNDHDETNITKIYMLQQIPNDSEESMKVLGIYIDQNLSLKMHIDFICGKISRAIFSLKLMKNILDKRHLRLLYNSYIHSHILYVSMFLSLCTETTLNPLVKIQKKAIRLICNRGYRDHTAQLFKTERILPVKSEIIYQSLQIMHSYKYSRLPIAFNSTWIESGQLRNYQLRNNEDYHIPHVRYLYLFNHPLYFMPRMWNEKINQEIKSISSKKIFSESIKNILLEDIAV